jgi:hypothetical protein
MFTIAVSPKQSILRIPATMTVVGKTLITDSDAKELSAHSYCGIESLGGILNFAFNTCIGNNLNRASIFL